MKNEKRNSLKNYPCLILCTAAFASASWSDWSRAANLFRLLRCQHFHSRHFMGSIPGDAYRFWLIRPTFSSVAFKALSIAVRLCDIQSGTHPQLVGFSLTLPRPTAAQFTCIAVIPCISVLCVRYELNLWIKQLKTK